MKKRTLPGWWNGRFLEHYVYALLCLGVAGCGGDNPTGDDPTDDLPVFALTFSGDASFQGPHADQIVSFFLVRTSGAEIVTGGGGIVFGPPASLSWVISWSVRLHLGEDYQIHYFFDSNFGGGTAGVCDAPEIDHQWKVLIPAVAGDIDVLVSHDPNAVTDVCSSFSR